LKVSRPIRVQSVIYLSALFKHFTKALSKKESGVILFLGSKWMFELFLDFFLLEVDAQAAKILCNLPAPPATLGKYP